MKLSKLFRWILYTEFFGDLKPCIVLDFSTKTAPIVVNRTMCEGITDKSWVTVKKDKLFAINAFVLVITYYINQYWLHKFYFKYYKYLKILFKETSFL